MTDLRLKTLLISFMVGLTTLGDVFSQDTNTPVYRLPSTITPQLYMLRLEPDLDSGIIRGTVKIEINTTSDESQPLTSITLHLGTGVIVNEMTSVILNTDGQVLDIGAFVYDDANTILKLMLPEAKTLSYNHIYVISIEFQSTLNTESTGLFVGYFNSTSKYIASNFRPTHARDVFPCFDEPHFKVPIALQVLRPASYYAISTASLYYSSAITADNMVLDTFFNTEAISIHSLGLFIGNQPAVQSMGVSVIAPSSFPSNVSYLETLISGINRQYGSFPTLLSLIVLPDRTHTSFSSYGLVFTSPEVYLGEVDSNLQWTSLQLQLTEEFLRQYLEYSKTPHWWSDLWLSESIGAYLSLPFQQEEPWLEDWLTIVVRSVALGDYTSASGPVISSEDLSKWDIENLISNQTVKFKGLSILLMWTHTMPEGLVVQTVADFLKLPKFVVSTDDLVNLMVTNIEANTTYDVTPTIPLLPNWLSQPGNPLVGFTIDSSNLTFTLDQGSPCSVGSPASALRSISVAVAEGLTPDWDNFRQGYWLLNSSAQFAFNNVSQALQGSIINIETAPYRVNYKNFQWSTLIQDLSSGWASAAVASALQDDAVALSLEGCLDFSTALSILNSTSRSGLDWWPVIRATDAIIANIGSDWYGFTAFGTYFASLFTADLLYQLDVRNSNSYPELSVTRELVTPWLCRFNIGTCREAVVELGANLWQGNISGIAGSDLENVACYGARYTAGALGPLLEAYQSAENVYLRRYFTIAISCLTEQSAVNSLLDTFINSTQITLRSEDPQLNVDQSDARQVLIGLASSLENVQSIVNFVINHSTDIQTKFGVSTLSSIIKNLAKNRANLSQLSSLQDDSLDLDPYVVQSVDQALAIANLSQTWYSNFSSQLYDVLPQGQSTTTTSTTTTPPTTTAGTTTSQPPTGPTTITTTTTPAPGGAPALSSFSVFTLVLTTLLIAPEISL